MAQYWVDLNGDNYYETLYTDYGYGMWEASIDTDGNGYFDTICFSGYGCF
jgi:hypothetical protein